MVSFSRLFAAESLALVGATVPFPAQNGTLLLREQTRSYLRKDCRVIARPDLPIRALRRTQGIEALRYPTAIGYPSAKPLIFARQHRGPGPGGFPPSRGGVARTLGRRR